MMRSIAKAVFLYPLLAIVFCAAMLAVAAAPAAASCPPGTLMKQNSMDILSGNPVPGTGSTTTCLQSGKAEQVKAPASISGPKGSSYKFLFWDINSKLRTPRLVNFTVSKGEPAFTATAWYLYQSGPCSGPSCSGSPNVTTIGFEVDKNMKLPGTPIASVSPATNGWKAPAVTVYTTSAVTINAANPVELIYWRLIPMKSAGVTVKGAQISAGEGDTSLALAFYGPNPCHLISPPAPGELGPGASVAAYQAAAKYDIEMYNECIVRHGGTPPSP